MVISIWPAPKSPLTLPYQIMQAIFKIWNEEDLSRFTTNNWKQKKKKMSGARLCALLGELGYQGAETLDPDSFEWPFQYDDARPILDWICSSLRPSNVLSLSELSQLVTIPLFLLLFLLIFCYTLRRSAIWIGMYIAFLNNCLTGDIQVWAVPARREAIGGKILMSVSLLVLWIAVS